MDAKKISIKKDTDLIWNQIFDDWEKCDGNYSVGPNRTAISRQVIHPIWKFLVLRDKHEEESNNQDWDNESKNEVHLSIFIKEIKSYPQILWKTIG